MSAKAAAKAAGIGRSSLYRLRDSDPEIRALMERNAHRARAKVATERAEKRAFRSVAESVAVVPELVDDANSIGGPPLAQLMQRGWELFDSDETDGPLRAVLFRELMRVKAAPMLAELQRQANAQPALPDQGSGRARLVLPDKAPLPG